MNNGLIVFFGTDNLEETDKFYRGLLGLQLYKDQGVCKIYKVSDNSGLGFCNHIEKTVKDKSPIITLLTEDVDGVYNNLVDKGYKVDNPPEKNDKFNIYHFFVKDNNGYTVEIQKFL
ncbi:VOC family protein [Clostridium sp. D2Q-11]|uniref:VOC family protein n=1 Tax=Anaeromonas frigoriresistens TaxID=2683708 RepID=A0A942V247_9FIRM|nr:VOC family protein [Anaeromonas frigoriresistens]